MAFRRSIITKYFKTKARIVLENMISVHSYSYSTEQYLFLMNKNILWMINSSMLESLDNFRLDTDRNISLS